MCSDSELQACILLYGRRLPKNQYHTAADYALSVLIRKIIIKQPL
jgi:hypothetical protein